jgi:predicted enzyme related to lactoylglutathione lyase
MPRVIGPDFVGLQAEDLAAARRFYEGTLGLPVARATPEAVVFATPVPFAVRLPIADLGAAPRGAGVGLWLGVEDARGLHDRLAAEGVPVLAPPAPTPFGLAFTVADPAGYALVLHEVVPAPAA